MLLYIVITAKLEDSHFLTVLASVFHCIFGTISDCLNIMRFLMIPLLGMMKIILSFSFSFIGVIIACPLLSSGVYISTIHF